jgi:hypothetical protein
VQRLAKAQPSRFAGAQAFRTVGNGLRSLRSMKNPDRSPLPSGGEGGERSEPGEGFVRAIFETAGGGAALTDRVDFFRSFSA